MPARLTVAGEACDKSSTSNRIDTCTASGHLEQHFECALQCFANMNSPSRCSNAATSQVGPDAQQVLRSCTMPRAERLLIAKPYIVAKQVS